MAVAPSSRKVAWFSRRSAVEYSGFLEWLWCLDRQPCDVIDLTEVRVTDPTQNTAPVKTRLALSLGLLTARQILDSGLIDHPEMLTAEARGRYREIWHRLRTENAPLRVLSAEGLVSAPITFFDELLLNCAADRWQRTARIVGEVLANELSASILQTGDLVLFSRVRV